ncbi:MAG: YezD family protein [Sphingomonadales bacterium]|nr:YezD family protein [Sphingomonadales bacterium]
MSSSRDHDPPPEAGAGNDPARLLEESLASVREALSGLRFGSVTLTIHDGRVVQIDITEKKRLRPN